MSNPTSPGRRISPFGASLEMSAPDAVRQESSTGANNSETVELLGGAPAEDEAFSRALLKKLHRRLLPFTGVVVVLSYLDRGNLGFVAADVCAELDLNHTRYGVGVALFGVGYITSQIPSNYFLRRFGPTLWMALLLVVWGVVAASFSFIQSRYEFYFLRLLLGVAEGGTFPGVWYFLTLFFPADRLTFPYMMMECALALSSPLASVLAAGLISLDDVTGVDGWRLLFFVEGVLPIVYGALFFWLMPSSPDAAPFLTAEEKTWLEAHHPVETSSSTLTTELRVVSRNPSFWKIATAGFLRGALLTAAFYWTTLIIDDMLNGDDDEDDDDTCASSESTDVEPVILTAVPFSVCAIFGIGFGHFGKDVRNRSRIAAIVLGVSGIFLFGWVIFRHVSFVMALIFLSLAISSIVTPNAMMVGLVGSLFDKETRATAIAAFNTVGGLGMTFGPLAIGLIVDHEGYGLAVSLLAGSALAAGLALGLVTDPLTLPKRTYTNEADGENDLSS